MTKPIYVGFSVLECSKTIMNDFMHGYPKPKYGSLDRVICDVQTPEVYKDMTGDAREWFDTSIYSEDHPSGIEVGLN